MRFHVRPAVHMTRLGLGGDRLVGVVLPDPCARPPVPPLELRHRQPLELGRIAPDGADSGTQAQRPALLPRSTQLPAESSPPRTVPFLESVANRRLRRSGPTTLAALRAALADRYAVATANASVNAIRGALRAAWLSGDMDRAMLERSLAALRQVRGNAAPGRALSPVEVEIVAVRFPGDVHDIRHDSLEPDHRR